MNAGTFKPIGTIAKRELSGYFASPVAFVFIVIFLLLSGFFTFMVAGFFERGQANLETFFQWHPWLYLFLVPAVGMRMWSEERRLGTIELLLTMPVTPWQAIVGKFLAAWAVVGLALALTFPVWITVNYLGHPDNGVILASYLGSFLMAGAYLAIGSAISAATSNQVIAFVVSVVVCFLFTAAGAPLVTETLSGWAPLPLVEAVASFSFTTHFQAITDGVIDVRDVIFFFSLIGLFLFANVTLVETGKGG